MLGQTLLVVDGPWTGTSGVCVETRGPLVRLLLDDDRTIVIHVSKVEVA